MRITGKNNSLLIGALIAIILLSAFPLNLVLSPRPLEAAFNRIQVGMSDDEVREILAGRATKATKMCSLEPECYRQKDTWLLPGSDIVLSLDRNERVVEKRLYTPSMDGIWLHWKRKLGLQGHY